MIERNVDGERSRNILLGTDFSKQNTLIFYNQTLTCSGDRRFIYLFFLLLFFFFFIYLFIFLLKKCTGEASSEKNGSCRIVMSF